jgi:archaellum biogenesis protein FlaJ (TadC family)
MNKFKKILLLILEIITAPFNALVKSNGLSVDSNRWTKPLIIFGIAIVLVVVMVLICYRTYIFK